MANTTWSVIRVRGDRGPPGIDGLEFLHCIGAVRHVLSDFRWHHRWIDAGGGLSRDGLRVELPFGSAAQKRLVTELESRIPPPAVVYAEPLSLESDLDSIQSAEEQDVCLTLLWRYAEFIVDLVMRNSNLRTRHLQALTPNALLTFVTGDRRHLEAGVREQRAGVMPAVPLARLADLIGAEPVPYRVPPENRADGVNAARIHHLMACTFASEYYPFAPLGRL